VKLPWYIDLLNLNLDHHDLAEARARIDRYVAAFRSDGTRVTENQDFLSRSPGSSDPGPPPERSPSR
jgi:hypothetical protein